MEPEHSGMSEVGGYVSGPIEPVRPSPLYVLGLVAVAITLLLLPLLYIGLIAGVGFLVFYHAVESAAIFEGRGGIIGRGLLYVAPLLAGVIVIIFLIKPLVIRRSKTTHPYSVERHQEPVLYAMVDQVADATGAPRPRLIEVSCDVNASASFRRGVWSMFSDDLVLTLGMPLVVGLDARQLAGIIAHELGHFSQRFGMRLTYIIRSINGWFARMVYERDRFDEQLIAASESDGFGWIILVALFCRLCVWLTRWVLWGLMTLSHAISCYMLRQMEFNADRYEIRMSGSKDFEAVTNRVRDLNMAYAYIMYRLGDARSEGRLCDNLPELIVATVESLPREAREQSDEPTRFLDQIFRTHPTDEERIERAREEESPGVFRVDAPAASLLQMKDVLCKWTTLSVYHNFFGHSVDPESLQPVSKMVTRQKLVDTALRSEHEFFHDLLSPNHMVFVRKVDRDRAIDGKKAVGRLRAAARRMRELAPKLKDVAEQLNNADSAYCNVVAADALKRSGFKSTYDVYNLRKMTKAQLATQRDAVRQAVNTTRKDFEEFDNACVARLTTAVALLAHPEIQSRVSGAEKLFKHAEQLVSGLRGIEQAYDSINGVRDDLLRLLTILNHYKTLPDEAIAASRVRDAMGDLHRSLSFVNTMLDAEDYPLEHKRSRLSMAAYVVGTMPSRDDPYTLTQTATNALERYFDLYRQVIGRLAMLTLKVEKALGLRGQRNSPNTPKCRASEAMNSD